MKKRKRNEAYLKFFVQAKSLGNSEVSETITIQTAEISLIFVFPHPFLDIEVPAQVKYR